MQIDKEVFISRESASFARYHYMIFRRYEMVIKKSFQIDAD